ncbi:hypothetical protein I601_1444 [Nocardioides dokdonensis FR1436]|uniref:Uncharacterized protein n=1 Tax=Nocardioides dokdonensis FR1436 TaxID=1300347 RepID=A0A1A9GJM9_9ACTN|nr:hypothetical protein [Nocardioides dokdonensis]ANH37880.1 hypothetical protein I601_1444 [Nocardioides dokdonensis FR1436]
MRFTENEMTQAMAGAAKSVLATRKDVRKKQLDVDQVWEQMTRYERFQVLDALGDQVLPVLVALPDVEVESGTRPTFTDEQVRETVEATIASDVGRLQRAVLQRTRVALVQAALAAVPPRQDPDALIVPDHL